MGQVRRAPPVRGKDRVQRFGSTPLGWARYFGQEQLIELLEPLTAPEEPGEPAS